MTWQQYWQNSLLQRGPGVELSTSDPDVLGSNPFGWNSLTRFTFLHITLPEYQKQPSIVMILSGYNIVTYHFMIQESKLWYRIKSDIRVLSTPETSCVIYVFLFNTSKKIKDTFPKKKKMKK